MLGAGVHLLFEWVMERKDEAVECAEILYSLTQSRLGSIRRRCLRNQHTESEVKVTNAYIYDGELDCR